ncbi:MAG TPA: protein kinase [Candidatus Krumholzibacteria bacterium]|nr:protein kinase [Candidatus Krumholzibacteria bacterium]
MRLAPGISLGPYVIAEHLGSGGMGDVYRATDPRLGRDVAVKVLNAAPDADRLARFEREARATALLAHSNILTIFDIGTHDGAPFMVCELLEGDTLRERLSTGPLGVEATLTIGLQLARGVAAAHSLRVVHRDLKPENLVITRSGTLKILDFGLAKLQEQPLREPEANTIGMSSPGVLIGTPAYMSPEQVRGALVDERSDVFAIGTILYEMLSGRNPFARLTAAETLAAILHESPAPLKNVPPEIAALVERCLYKKPGDRFQNASDLIDAMEAARLGEATTSASPQADEVRSIAVLPFLDMSAARDQDYLCDDIADELINALTHIDGLRVAARSTSFQFKSAKVDARAVGARLGVDSVLEGGVRKAGDRLRVTVQLVDVADGYQLWSHRFDGTIEDVFHIQDQIAERVATALRGLLSGREKDALRRPGTEAAAYEYYLRGRQQMHTLSRTSAFTAKEMFDRAIEIDPNYAPAYAGLAQLHAWEYEWWGGGERAADAADKASRKALELAPQLSESHTARAAALAQRGRYDEAAREYEEAIRLNPNSFDAYYYYARASFAAKKIAKSAELFARAGELRPEDFQSPALLAQSLWMMGQENEARAANEEGIRRVERWLELDPHNLRALALGATALANQGQAERAFEWMDRAIATAPEDPSIYFNAACVYAKLNRKEEALACLEQTLARGFGKRDWIEQDPDYDSIRDDPRFQAMLDKLS